MCLPPAAKEPTLQPLISQKSKIFASFPRGGSLTLSVTASPCHLSQGERQGVRSALSVMASAMPPLPEGEASGCGGIFCVVLVAHVPLAPPLGELAKIFDFRLRGVKRWLSQAVGLERPSPSRLRRATSPRGRQGGRSALSVTVGGVLLLPSWERRGTLLW